MAKLSNKQKAFIAEYLIDFNATQAALRAGYSERSASSIGSENLTKPEIKAEIEQAIEEKQMTADEVLTRLADIARADVGDFLRFEDGISLPFLDLKAAKEKGLLKLIKKFKYTDKGIPEIELHDAMSALQLIGKNLGLFKDQSANINIDLSELTNEQLERIAGGEEIFTVLATSS